MVNRWGKSGNSGWLYILGSKITADCDCSHEIERRLRLGRKVMVNLDSILKSRDSTLPTKVHLVKAIVFPVVIYGCKSWTKKKADLWRTDGFEVWCWRRLLRVPWTASISNQSILKEIRPEYSLGGHWRTLNDLEGCWRWNSNILTPWCEELTHLKRPWWCKRLKARGEGNDRGWDHWVSQTQWAWVWVNSGSWWWTGRPGVLQSMGSQRVGHDWAAELNWTEGSWITKSISWYKKSHICWPYPSDDIVVEERGTEVPFPCLCVFLMVMTFSLTSY